MSEIRPVCGKLPVSLEVVEDSNLPLGVVLTPLSSPLETDEARWLVEIPKCLKCGAPHPTKDTHFQLPNLDFLCYLCGQVSSSTFAAQSQTRETEDLQHELYHPRHNITNTSVFRIGKPQPVLVCPPVWWIVLDASADNRLYWNVVSQVLLALDIPSYVHVGLIVVEPDEQIAVMDLQSATPHLLHHTGGALLQLVPANPLYRANLQAAFRALSDYPMSSSSSKTTQQSSPLALAIPYILDFVQENATLYPDTTTPQDDDSRPTDRVSLSYAGGKIMCFMTPRRASSQRAPTQIGLGGRAGNCSNINQRWSLTSHQEPHVEVNHTTDDAHYYHELGVSCGCQGLGVDLLVLQQDHDMFSSADLNQLQFLTGPSGAPGPLVLDLKNVDTILEQVQARVPWKVALGAELRLRLSPGFQIDTSPVDDSEPNSLATLYSSHHGIMGPACRATEAAALPSNSQLWRLGTCDSMYTAACVDLQVPSTVPDRFHVDHYGPVAYKPVLQTCFAYNRILKDDEGRVWMVREMRICSLPMSFAQTAEELYSSLDPDALGVVLFHKMTLSALRDGLVETQEIGNDWLKAFLVCVYRSAQIEDERQRRRQQPTTDVDNPDFFPNERLMDREGELTGEQVLLAQGHKLLQTVPFLVYCLLQSDAFRLANQAFYPSLDARCAAMAQMSSMTPSILSRCLAPRLELWVLEDDAAEPLATHLELSMACLQDHVREYEQQESNLILFLDSPEQVVVCNARANATEVVPILGDHIEQVMEQALASYRTRPVLIRGGLLQEDAILNRVQHAMIQDGCTPDFASYEEWKSEIAAQVLEELQKYDDLEG